MSFILISRLQQFFLLFEHSNGTWFQIEMAIMHSNQIEYTLEWIEKQDDANISPFLILVLNFSEALCSQAYRTPFVTTCLC